MQVTDVTPEVSGHAANGEAVSECAVCPHPWTSHDVIAARYCTATTAGGPIRGCVCTANAGHEQQGLPTTNEGAYVFP
jgi:hypothetical protein